jgi:hypothetical protein
MDREIVRICKRDDWRANSFVGVGDSWSVLSEGFFNRVLKLPVTRDLVACLEFHKQAAEFKYQRLFASPEFAATVAGNGDVPLIEDGIVFIGANTYWHFVMLGLGSLRYVGEGFANFYVDADTSADKLDFLRKFLARIGYRRIPDILPLDAGNYRVRNCAFFFAGNDLEAPRWIRKTLGIAGNASARKRIYVGRSGAALRNLVNSEAIANVLQAEFGFESVDPGQLAIEEQIRLFAEAAVLVGPHGAGLTNAVFMGNPQLLGEFFAGLLQPFYPILAQSIGAKYFSLEGRRVGEHPSGDWRQDNADFAVDEKAVLQALRRYL